MKLESQGKWAHKWFGFFQAAGDQASSFPDIEDFIDPDWQPEDKTQLIEYLKLAPCVLAGPVGMAKCRFCEMTLGGSTFYSDGTWLWPKQLIHYVTSHNLVLPDAFADFIRYCEYAPPKVCKTPINALPWPTQVKLPEARPGGLVPKTFPR